MPKNQTNMAMIFLKKKKKKIEGEMSTNKPGSDHVI